MAVVKQTKVFVKVVICIQSTWIQDHICICIKEAAVCIVCNEIITFLYEQKLKRH
jgi:hypothetical protein